MRDELQRSATRKRRRRRKTKGVVSILRLPLDLSGERTKVIEDSEMVAEVLRPVLGHPLQEIMVSIALDGRGRIIDAVIVAVGTLTACLAHPREIFRDAVKKSAASIILVHTHPSGDPEPSDEDRILTHRVEEAGEVLGIPLLDHVVLGKDTHWSFVENRCLSTKGAKWTKG